MNTNNIKLSAIQYSTIDELTAREFHEIIALRESIFVVEQNCAYQDADGFDTVAIHVRGHVDGHLVTYVRILPPATKYSSAVVIGRIVTDREYRGQGFAGQLIASAIAYCQKQFIDFPIKISAQAHLQGYYESFGFVAYGDIYSEDEIPHIAMQITS